MGILITISSKRLQLLLERAGYRNKELFGSPALVARSLTVAVLLEGFSCRYRTATVRERAHKNRD